MMIGAGFCQAQSVSEVMYETGELKSSYFQENGLVKVTHFYTNGVVKETGFFKNGIPEGKWESFAESGKKTAELSYKDGKRHGEFRGWDVYADTYTEMHYSNGKVLDANKWIKTGDFAAVEK